MAFTSRPVETPPLEFGWTELTGAVGDSVTVLPLVIAIGVLTELSVAIMLIWFGVFQIVWGLVYGAPISVEPMKALAALLLAGTITTGGFVLAGLLVGVVLLAAGATGTLARLTAVIDEPVVRGIQLGVALVLLRTGVQLGLGNPRLGTLAAAIALGLLVIGAGTRTALVVVLVGGGVAVVHAGLPEPTLPATDGVFLLAGATPSIPVIEATIAQLAMTVGNAALAASVLLAEYFDRDVSPDDLATSMGAMTLLAVPLGGLPMCHGSGGIAGKYAFGARTAGANLLLGVGYVAIAVVAVGLVTSYPVSMLGVVLVLIAWQLVKTSLQHSRAYRVVVGIAIIGVVANLGVALVVGIATTRVLDRHGVT